MTTKKTNMTTNKNKFDIKKRLEKANSSRQKRHYKNIAL